LTALVPGAVCAVVRYPSEACADGINGSGREIFIERRKSLARSSSDNASRILLGVRRDVTLRASGLLLKYQL
jgi:hypothetical protein